LQLEVVTEREEAMDMRNLLSRAGIGGWYRYSHSAYKDSEISGPYPTKGVANPYIHRRLHLIHFQARYHLRPPKRTKKKAVLEATDSSGGKMMRLIMTVVITEILFWGGAVIWAGFSSFFPILTRPTYIFTFGALTGIGIGLAWQALEERSD